MNIKQCFRERVKALTPSEKVAVKEFIMLLKDKKWHELYELHDLFNLSPLSISNSIDFLLERKIIKLDAEKVRLESDLNNESYLLLNLLMKTEKPNVLNNIMLNVS